MGSNWRKALLFFVLFVIGGAPGWVAFERTATTPATSQKPVLGAFMPNAWQTQYDIDFTAQSTLNFKTGGNGTKSIGGKTWTWANDAAATTAGLTNGTGIAVNPGANSGSASPASRLGPILTIPLTNLLPTTLNVARHTVRVMARVQVSGHTKVAQGVRLGLEDAATPKDQAVSVFKGWASNAPGDGGAGNAEFVFQSSKPTATASLTVGDTGTFTDDVLLIDFEPPDIWDARTGAFSGGGAGGFPYKFPTYRTSEVMDISAPLLRLPAEPVVVLAWQDSAASGGGSFTGTVTHLRVEWLEKYPF